MKSVQIQLTTKCNQRCFMCRKYCWEHRSIDVKTLEEKIAKYKDCTFTFSGGDPLSYEHLGKLNKLIRKYKIVYQVFTNLNYVLDETKLIFLRNAKYIQVSLDGATDATYSIVRRPIEEGFHRVVSNITILQNTSPEGKIKVNCTVSNRNYFEVERICSLCNSLKVNVRLFPVHTDEEAKLEGYMIEHIKKQISRVTPRNYEAIMKPFMEAIEREEYTGDCFVKKEHRLIDENGVEYPCCRAINDNGYEWGERNSVKNLEDLDDEKVLYDFCSNCDRYRKFNKHWNTMYEDKEELFL